jgi:UDP-N-acetylmuramyl tripeptide synthase
VIKPTSDNPRNEDPEVIMPKWKGVGAQKKTLSITEKTSHKTAVQLAHPMILY